MDILDNEKYLAEVAKIAKLKYSWSYLKNKSLLITGASGLIGSFLIDVVMFLNNHIKLNCQIIAVCRNEKKAQKRFNKYLKTGLLTVISHDVNIPFDIKESVNYIIHAASNTHPKLYSSDPIGTITTNVIGTYNLLQLAIEKHIERFIFLSSVEIYGENVNNLPKFKEDDLGYINCNTLRAGYPESKRTGEALINAYIDNKGLDAVIVRLSRIYGPTIDINDSKAMSQFINRAVMGEDIVLKSAGNQYFSYNYVGDAVSAILFLLLNGENNEAYNVADESSDITLKNLANLIAKKVNTKVIFEKPNADEAKGYSTATRAIMNSAKLNKLGWQNTTSIDQGVSVTIDILKDLRNI